MSWCSCIFHDIFKYFTDVLWRNWHETIATSLLFKCSQIYVLESFQAWTPFSEPMYEELILIKTIASLLYDSLSNFTQIRDKPIVRLIAIEHLTFDNKSNFYLEEIWRVLIQQRGFILIILDVLHVETHKFLTSPSLRESKYPRPLECLTLAFRERLALTSYRFGIPQ